MDINQCFLSLPNDVRRAAAIGLSATELALALRQTRPEYNKAPAAALAACVQQEYTEVAEKQYQQPHKQTRILRPNSKHAVPPRPRQAAALVSATASGDHLNALVARFVKERVTSAHDKPPATFVTPERIRLDAVTLGEPENVTIFVDPRVMKTSASRIRVYSSSNLLQVISRPEPPLLRLTVKMLPNLEGPFSGSIIILVGHRRTIVPIEAQVVKSAASINKDPLPLFQPLRVPGLPIDSWKIPRKQPLHLSERNRDLIDSYPLRSLSSPLNGGPGANPLPMPSLSQSPTVDLSSVTGNKALTNKSSLSVGAIAATEHVHDSIVTYQACKEPHKYDDPDVNVLWIRKSSSHSIPSVSRRNTSETLNSQQALLMDDSDDFQNISTYPFTNPQQMRSPVPIPMPIGSNKPRYPRNIKVATTVDNAEHTDNPAFSAPNTSLNSTFTSRIDVDGDKFVLQEEAHLMESIVDVNVDAHNSRLGNELKLSVSSSLSSSSPKHKPINIVQLVGTDKPVSAQPKPPVLQQLPDRVDQDSSTNWGSLTAGEDSDEDNQVSVVMANYTLGDDEIYQMEQYVADWNAFSRFAPNEEVDATDGGVVHTPAEASNWHTSRLNLLANIVCVI